MIDRKRRDLARALPQLHNLAANESQRALFGGFVVIAKHIDATELRSDLLIEGARCREEVNKNFLPEERVIWRKRFHGQAFDLRGKSLFNRFDGCEFVKCTLLIDQDTEQLAFTGCVFKDCNIDRLEQNQERGL